MDPELLDMERFPQLNVFVAPKKVDISMELGTCESEPLICVCIYKKYIFDMIWLNSGISKSNGGAHNTTQ